MTDDVNGKFASVTITIRCGDQETVYDLPKVENVTSEVEYEPALQIIYPRIKEEESQLPVRLFTISMKPHAVNDTFYRITQINHGVTVET